MAMALPHNSLFTSPARFSKTRFSCFPSPIPLSEETSLTIFPNKKQWRSGSRWRPLASASAGSSAAPAPPGPPKAKEARPKLRILVAGGGIGGLVFALAAKKKGFDVMVFEKDLSAIRGEGQYRGPIQIQSNALAALEAIDMEVAEEVMSAGCITGDRINGLVDGVSGTW